MKGLVQREPKRNYPFSGSLGEIQQVPSGLPEIQVQKFGRPVKQGGPFETTLQSSTDPDEAIVGEPPLGEQFLRLWTTELGPSG